MFLQKLNMTDISYKGSETGSRPYFLHTGMKCSVYNTYLQLTNIPADIQARLYPHVFLVKENPLCHLML